MLHMVFFFFCNVWVLQLFLDLRMLWIEVQRMMYFPMHSRFFLYLQKVNGFPAVKQQLKKIYQNQLQRGRAVLFLIVTEDKCSIFPACGTMRQPLSRQGLGMQQWRKKTKVLSSWGLHSSFWGSFSPFQVAYWQPFSVGPYFPKSTAYLPML